MARPDERAASEIIGAVIVFGFLIVAFSVYQGIVIPQQNKAVEFDHNQATQDDLQQLRNAIREAATTGSEASVSITLGATYPPRVLGVNPGFSGGSVETRRLGSLVVANVTATDDEVDDYFGQTTTVLGGFETRAVSYRPVYSHYSEAPITRYENTLAYNEFRNGPRLAITHQAVVDGRKITLVVLDGNLSAGGRHTVTVDTEAVSPATTTTSINNSGGPINVTLPTQLSAANWTALLEDELDPNGTDPDRFVSAVRQTGPDRVSIVLEPGVEYELRLAKVGVGVGATDEPAVYLVDVAGDETSLTENGTQQLVVEVRDRFNNPVSNVTVRASIAQGASTSPGTKEAVLPTAATTDADGRATFIYQAPANVDGAQEADILTTFGNGTTAPERVVFDVRVLDADSSGGGSGGTGGINPSADQQTLVYVNATITNPDETVTLRLNNTNASAIEITELRFQFYSPAAAGTSRDTPDSLSFNGDTVGYLDQFTAVNEVVSPGIQSIPVDLFEAGGGVYDVREGDFVILTLRTDLGDTITYFIGITST